jgi:acid phosphatase
MHAGYADVASGDRHIAHAIKLLRASPQWDNMVVVVTVDENGGWWDHVAPPKGDRWGPGTRLPAMVISPFARKGTVDHTIYDTGSILRLITRVFGLEKLDGLKERDDAMVARGQQPMGDMTNALQFKF